MSEVRLIDGVTAIFISHTGKTELGRLLSEKMINNVVTPFGVFKNIVGYSAFLKTGCNNAPVFMAMSYRQAKDYIRSVEYVKNPNLTRCLHTVLYKNVMKNDELKRLLMESTLPFEGPDFLTKYYTKLRTRLLSSNRSDTMS